jgi:hypothetical protein
MYYAGLNTPQGERNLLHKAKPKEQQCHSPRGNTSQRLSVPCLAEVFYSFWLWWFQPSHAENCSLGMRNCLQKQASAMSLACLSQFYNAIPRKCLEDKTIIDNLGIWYIDSWMVMVMLLYLSFFVAKSNSPQPRSKHCLQWAAPMHHKKTDSIVGVEIQ